MPSSRLTGWGSTFARESSIITVGEHPDREIACISLPREPASLQTTAGVQSERMKAISSGVDMKSMGTTTAPMCQAPYRAIAHSGEFEASMATWSP